VLHVSDSPEEDVSARACFSSITIAPARSLPNRNIGRSRSSSLARLHPADRGGRHRIFQDPMAWSKESQVRRADRRRGTKASPAGRGRRCLAAEQQLACAAQPAGNRVVGMKAAANGAQFERASIGRWMEAWRPDNSNGWGIQPSPLSAARL